jgi:hypothetical protein
MINIDRRIELEADPAVHIIAEGSLPFRSVRPVKSISARTVTTIDGGSANACYQLCI